MTASPLAISRLNIDQFTSVRRQKVIEEGERMMPQVGVLERLQIALLQLSFPEKRLSPEMESAS